MEDDERRIGEAIEAEERRLAANADVEWVPGSPRIEEARLLSVITEVSLDVEGEVADEIAMRLLEAWPYAIARRAVELYAQRDPMPVAFEDVAGIATVIVESDRLAVLRRRAREGDKEAAAELVQIKRAMRRAVP